MAQSIPDTIILDDSSPTSRQSDKITIPLKKHQLALHHQCRILENSCRNRIKLYNPDKNTDILMHSQLGIIGDVVGSGKTLSILSLIASDPVIDITMEASFNYYSSGYTETKRDRIEVKPFNVIVIPHTIYKQWASTIEKMTTLTYFGIFNTKSFKSFTDIFNDEVKSKEFNYDIILISNTRFSDFSSLSIKFWKSSDKISRYIFDEADIIKIKAWTNINASFEWFVTSSYKSLLNPYRRIKYRNDAGELANYYNYELGFVHRHVMSGLSTGYVRNIMCSISFPKLQKQQLFIKNCEEFVKQSFSLPDYIMRIIKCDTPNFLKVLNKNVSQDILNRINAGDIKGAIEKVNCKKFNEEDLIAGITNELEEKLKNYKIQYEMKSQMTYSSETAKNEALIKMKIKIKGVSKKIQSIKAKMEESKMCAICYDNLDNTTVSPCCNTKYCFGCLSKWLHSNKNCPFCRAKLDFDSLVVVSDTVKPKETVKKPIHDKNYHLREIIHKQLGNPNFKMLIFSEYTNSFIKIREILESFKLSFRTVSGTTATINKTVRLFKQQETSDKIDVLLLDARFCANGINLENASDIVLYHSMNEDVTTQIIGRGQRPGRREQLNVWKLCYENELVK